MYPLIKKELGHFFNNPFGYIVVVLFALFANFLFVKDIFLFGQVSMRQFFVLIPWIYMVFLPAITMRALAEEKRMRTLEILQTIPLTASQIVLAKCIAILCVGAMGLLLTLGLPISMNMLAAGSGGALYLPEVLVAYGGTLLFMLMGISVTLFVSGGTSNQVVAFLLGALVLFVGNVMGTDVIGAQVPAFVERAITTLSPLAHLNNFVKGVIDLRSVFYFLSISGVAIYLTILDVEKRA